MALNDVRVKQLTPFTGGHEGSVEQLRFTVRRRLELDELIALPEYQSVALSPGRDRLAMAWNPDGRTELYLIDLRSGGPPRRLGNDLVPLGMVAGISWLDDATIAVAVDRDGNERHTLVRLFLDTAGAPTLLGGDARYQLGPSAPTGQELLVSSDRDGRMSLYLLDASARSLRHIASFATPPGPGCWSPDGQWIYVAASDAADLRNEDIYRVRRDGRVRECIFSSGTGSRDRPIRAAPDGRSLVIATDRSGFMQPAILDLRTGAVHDLGDGMGDESPADLSTDGRRILSMLSRGARTSLVEIDASDGRRQPLALPSGVLSDARYLWDGRILCGHADPRHRPRLLACAPEGSPVEGPRFDTVLDAEYGRLSPDAFADGEVLHVHSGDGLEIEGILYRPAAPPSTRAPAVVLIHGGPDLHDTLTFNPEVQALVSRGFAVLQVNYRGSTGRGREFLDLNIGDLGGGDADDVAAGARLLARDPAIDPTRILCAGGSYGGYLTYRSLTRHPELWAGGAAWFGITDWTRLYQESTSLLRHYLRLWFGGTPDEVPDRYRQASPVHDVRRIRSPLLILHGKADPRVPVGQARALRRELLEAGRLEGRDFVYHELDVGHGTPERDARLTIFHQLERFLSNLPR